jgi:hypothetical protein
MERSFQGTPLDRASAASDGVVVAVLPQGTYTLHPSFTSLSPGGSTTQQDLAPLTLTVGCQQVLEVVPDVYVRIDASLPECTTEETVHLTGTVVGTNDIASVSHAVSGGAPVVVCAACGPNPPIDVDVPLVRGANSVRVEAVDSAGNVAATTVFTRRVAEPSALDRAPAAEPLRVRRDVRGDLVITWETGGGPFNAYRGSIASLHVGRTYDHGEVGACAESASTVTLPNDAGSWYYLVVEAGCPSAPETSYGRNSFGVERPAANPRCP